MRLFETNAAGLWTRRRPTDKPGVAWLPQAGDPTVVDSTEPLINIGGGFVFYTREGLLSPGPPSAARYTAKLSAEACTAWFVLFLVVGEDDDYTAGGDWVSFLSGLSTMKLRGCDGDTIHLFITGSSVNFDQDITVTAMPWTDIGTFTRNPSGMGDTTYHVLCTIGEAAAGTPEAEIPFWFVPPPNTTFPTGYYPTKLWTESNQSPVSWAAGITLAQTINETVTHPTLGTEAGGWMCRDFTPYELPNEQVVTSAGARAVQVQTTLAATYSGVPSSAVAGAAFDFFVQLNSPMDPGNPAAAWNSANNGIYGVCGFPYVDPPFVTSSSVYDPGVSTDLGGGLYHVTGFKIYKAGVHRLKCVSRGSDNLFRGYNMRSPATIEVTPGSPSQLSLAVGPSTGDYCCGELMTGENRAGSIFSPLLSDYRGRFHVQGIDVATPTVTDKNGHTFSIVGNYTPLTVVTLDQWGNVCEADNSSVVTVTLVDFSGAIVPPSLAGTLTRTVSGGFTEFPDLRPHGLGRFALRFTSPGLTLFDAPLHLQPLLRIRANVSGPTVTVPVESGVVTVTLTDVQGHVLDPTPVDNMFLYNGSLGASGFTAVGTSVTPVHGIATFTGTFPVGAHGTFNFFAEGSESHYDDGGAYSNNVSF